MKMLLITLLVNIAGAPNLILTPHVGGVTREANARVSMMIAREVRRANLLLLGARTAAAQAGHTVQ